MFFHKDLAGIVVYFVRARVIAERLFDARNYAHPFAGRRIPCAKKVKTDFLLLLFSSFSRVMSFQIELTFSFPSLRSAAFGTLLKIIAVC